MAIDPGTISVAQAAQQIALQMLEELGCGAVSVGVSLLYNALEYHLSAALRTVRGTSFWGVFLGGLCGGL